MTLVLGARAAQAQHIIGVRDSLATRADSVFRAFDRSDAPGCALGVYRDGRIVYARGYGMANLELGVAITPRTVFDVGSVSKQFAALTMLLLEGDGRLHLDDPVRRLIPEMPPYADSVTWLNLLSHSGGLRDYLTLFALAGTSFEGYADTVDYLRLITRSATTNFPIGTRYLYSNTGWVLMAAATRRLTGKTVAEFADERIFQPLGMADTRWHWDNAAIYPNRATGYAPRGPGQFRTQMSQFNQFAGPGGVHTTVVDLLRWFQNYDSAFVGTREMLQRMQTPGRLADGSPVPAGGTSHYGLGLALGTYRGLRLASHGGSWAGYRAHVLRFPEQRLHVACLCNVTNAGPDTLALKVAGVYLGSLMGPDSATAWSDALTAAPATTLGADALNRLAGYWRNDSLGEVRRTRVSADALLFGHSQTASMTMLDPRRARVRPPAQGLIEVTFEGDSGGWPTRAVMRTRGGSLTWRRVTPVPLTVAQVAQYAGEWHSGEIDVVWTISLDSAGLEIRRPRQRSRLDNVGRDAFVDRASGTLLEFERDSRGGITALLLQSGRVRNLRFVRRTAAATAAR